MRTSRGAAQAIEDALRPCYPPIFDLALSHAIPGRGVTALENGGSGCRITLRSDGAAVSCHGRATPPFAGGTRRTRLPRRGPIAPYDIPVIVDEKAAPRPPSGAT
jgi:hypothetical protein